MSRVIAISSTTSQNYAPVRHMDVAKNVGFGLKVRTRSTRDIDARVKELLALVKHVG